MRSSILLALALAACATASPELSPSPGRTLWIENRTPDALVVRVDGVRVATVLGQRGACIGLPGPGQALTAARHRPQGDVRRARGEHAAGWNWHIRSAPRAPR